VAARYHLHTDANARADTALAKDGVLVTARLPSADRRGGRARSDAHSRVYRGFVQQILSRRSRGPSTTCVSILARLHLDRILIVLPRAA
jgi:hypothetical protein